MERLDKFLCDSGIGTRSQVKVILKSGRVTLDGIPAGLPVDQEKLIHFLARRAPGGADWSTPRKEADTPEFLGGIVDGFTCGAPIAATIKNTNTHSADYNSLKDCPRPGHADYTAQVKYGGYQDAAGGGHFSGRLTAPMCIAGGLCLQWLQEMGIHIRAHILKLGDILDESFDPCCPNAAPVNTPFPVISEAAGVQMRELIQSVKQNGDSIGGIIECMVTGLPAGIGEPMFGGIENRLSQILFGIPAVKGVEFGDDICIGSEYNDSFTYSDGHIHTRTNHCGGILGGISNGMNILFKVRIKPTPSIAREQHSISLSTKTDCVLQVKGRHDPCILPRAVPVVEAAAAIALFDLILINTQRK